MFKLLVVFLVLYLVFVYQNNSPGKSTTNNIKPPLFEDPFVILGVSSLSTDEEIKQAYRDQLKKNHPDLVAHMSKDFQNLAESKLKQINWAYDDIKKIRGFK